MIESFERLALTSTQYYTQLASNVFSQKLADCPPIKRMDSLTVKNFKSFSKYQSI